MRWKLAAAIAVTLIAMTATAVVAADPPTTSYCRNAYGDVIVCPPCPSAPPGKVGPLLCDIDSQPRREVYPVPGCKFNTIADAGADERYEAGCEPYAYAVVPITQLAVRLVSQTSTTITLGWDPPPGTDGYRFTRSDSTKRSHTWNGARDTVTFGKGAANYKVETLRVGQTGNYAP